MMHEGVKADNSHLKMFSQFMDYMEKRQFGPNAAFYIGHNTIRVAVMGYANREPSPEELKQMEKYVEDAMKSGALGISLGLYYAPGTYSKTDEAIALCKVVAKYGGSLSLVSCKMNLNS